ncbi:hypothetical protein BC477_16570 [Clavibacter michiganensis subsp. michiganensis]|uniref:Uncharacterized protein n=1 Tax=Clavibacter michiganensis subsp. michiganensis TaxID=33013 RepID=A0A251XFA4_CLAMM|nr:hypothetical protein BC477_16570 [Clavibacter michiganensis subsp. michiganensis]OUE00478.1 hypothetical protein CMMCAS07_18930 [Clavibacter michiganensis subsp. michiganensis]
MAYDETASHGTSSRSCEKNSAKGTWLSPCLANSTVFCARLSICRLSGMSSKTPMVLLAAMPETAMAGVTMAATSTPAIVLMPTSPRNAPNRVEMVRSVFLMVRI